MHSLLARLTLLHSKNVDKYRYDKLSKNFDFLYTFTINWLTFIVTGARTVPFEYMVYLIGSE